MSQISFAKLDPRTGKPWRIGIYVHSFRASPLKRLRQEARRRGVKAETILFSDVHIAVKPPKKFTIYLEKEKYILPPVVINRLPASAPGLGLLVLSHFERTRRSKIINRAYRTSLGRDKFRVMQVLASKGFQVPATVLLGSARERDLRWAVKLVGGFPAILKLARGSLGVGVIKVDSMSALQSTFDLVKKTKQPMVLQQYLASEPGVDYRFYVVGHQVVAAMKRVAKRKTEFRANISLGGQGLNYSPTKQEKELAIKVVSAIGLDVCGVDFIRTENGLVPIEVNTNANFKGIEKATGVNVAGKIIDYCLNQAIQFRHKKQQQSRRANKKRKAA